MGCTEQLRATLCCHCAPGTDGKGGLERDRMALPASLTHQLLEERDLGELEWGAPAIASFPGAHGRGVQSSWAERAPKQLLPHCISQ